MAPVENRRLSNQSSEEPAELIVRPNDMNKIFQSLIAISTISYINFLFEPYNVPAIYDQKVIDELSWKEEKKGVLFLSGSTGQDVFRPAILTSKINVRLLVFRCTPYSFAKGFKYCFQKEVIDILRGPET